MFPWSKEKDQQHEMGQGKEIIDGITTLFTRLFGYKKKKIYKEKRKKKTSSEKIYINTFIRIQ